jgi:hypothetical protein
MDVKRFLTQCEAKKEIGRGEKKGWELRRNEESESKKERVLYQVLLLIFSKKCQYLSYDQ